MFISNIGNFQIVQAFIPLGLRGYGLSKVYTPVYLLCNNSYKGTRTAYFYRQ